MCDFQQQQQEQQQRPQHQAEAPPDTAPHPSPHTSTAVKHATRLCFTCLLSLVRDHIKLYDATSWESLGEFTAETVDLVAIEFSPDGCTLCLQDISLE